MLHSGTMKLVKCWPSKIQFDQFNSILWLNAFSRKALLHTRLVYFMAVLHSRGDLSEEVPGLLLWQSLFVLNVFIQLSSARVLHHHHHPLSALKHWRHNTCLMSLSTHTHTHGCCETADVIYPHTDGWYVGAQERRWSPFLSGCELCPDHPSISAF